MELPTFSGAAKSEPPPPVDAPVPGGDETVLLVEDEAVVRTVMRRTLEGRGYTVLTAGHAEEAFRAAGAHVGSIDLLVTDIVLPGENGRALAGRIDTLRPELRGVVFVSGHAQEALGAPKISGRHVLLRKPFAAPALLRAARRVLDD